MDTNESASSDVALDRFFQSLKQLDGISLHRLGTKFEKGDGVQQDLPQAFGCYHKAAEMGFAPSMHNVAIMYAEGQGVSQDLSKAFEFYNKAAETGYALSMHNLALMYEKGNYLAKDKNLYLKWLHSAADGGYNDSQFLLGLEYFYGTSIPKNLSTACTWLSKAAAQDHLIAQSALAQIHYNGFGAPVNYDLAFEEFHKLANEKKAIGYYHLGKMYESGKGTPKNIQLSIKYYLLAAENNYPSAFTCVGNIYQHLSKQPNSEESRLATFYFGKAANLGDLAGMILVANNVAHGIGYIKCKATARLWYEKALTLNQTFGGDDQYLLSLENMQNNLESLRKIIRKELADLAKGCFISTATALSMGWKDDGPELNALRMFRDVWMQKTQDRRDEVSEYYRIAPEIVKCIDATTDSALIYRHLCDAYLCPALGAIQSKNYQEAYEIYSAMVMSLCDQYISRSNQLGNGNTLSSVASPR